LAISPATVATIVAVLLAFTRLIPKTKPWWGKLPTWAQPLPPIAVVVCGFAAGAIKQPAEWIQLAEQSVFAILAILAPGALPAGAAYSAPDEPERNEPSVSPDDARAAVKALREQIAVRSRASQALDRIARG
jgi:hypothetical protein